MVVELLRYIAKCVLLLIVILLVNIDQAFAAFPIRQYDKSTVTTTQDQIKNYQPNLVPTKLSSNKGKNETGTLSLLAFVSGILSVIVTYGIAFKGGPNVAPLITGGILGAVAVVLGDAGAQRKLQGLAYAGEILGSISVIPILIIALWTFNRSLFYGNFVVENYQMSAV